MEAVCSDWLLLLRLGNITPSVISRFSDDGKKRRRRRLIGATAVWHNHDHYHSNNNNLPTWLED